MLVEDLFIPKFLDLFKADLLRVYGSILKTGSVYIERKNQLSTTSLCLIALLKLEKLGGYNTNKLLRETIKEYAHILTKDDQKARRSQVDANLKKIQTTSSNYDISELLLKSLC